MSLYRFATAGTAERTLPQLGGPNPIRLPRRAASWLQSLAALRQRWQDAAALAQVDQHVLRDIGVAGHSAMDAERLYGRIRMAANGLPTAHLPTE